MYAGALQQGAHQLVWIPRDGVGPEKEKTVINQFVFTQWRNFQLELINNATATSPRCKFQYKQARGTVMDRVRTPTLLSVVCSVTLPGEIFNSALAYAIPAFNWGGN